MELLKKENKKQGFSASLGCGMNCRIRVTSMVDGDNDIPNQES